MKVVDYYNDMILGQKWAIEVETTCIHLGSDFYETDGYGNAFMKSTEPCEDLTVKTLHYSVPSGKCNYFNSEVCYFRVINDEIYLSVREIIEI